LFEEEISIGSRPIEYIFERVVIKETNNVERFS